jgi:hypothetical protein
LQIRVARDLADVFKRNFEPVAAFVGKAACVIVEQDPRIA